VQPVGKRDVNSLDLRICQQSLVTPITLRDPILFGRLSRGLLITGSDGDDIGAGVRSRRVEEGGRVDHGRGEDADLDCRGGFGDLVGLHAFVPVLVEKGESLTYLGRVSTIGRERGRERATPRDSPSP
jgi:hypothetical protein